MSLKHGLLGLLNYNSMTGYDLSKFFSDSLSFFWTATTSQVYRELTTMERDGWVTSEVEVQFSKPNKKIYSITKVGKQELQDWLTNPNIEQDNPSERNPMLMKVFFGAEVSKEIMMDYMAKTKEYYEGKLKELHQAKEIIAYNDVESSKDKILYWRLCESYGEYCCKAILEWIEEAVHSIKEES
ncbi:DNA-binding transcriptional regulator, PadR family [Anaerosporobacter mobilis DSM 15930]|uniref:DNA-binding transcriptional regulator, PadR family n=1 Tax=Anaerosporobacter mobilis DSM 15930 TaxID=1120996 RepID=A0A1M7HWF9_9FIRM|nr:PadR family transcriptional regulator [Anaerosporobacter mobilis]SHM32824.1 DNA-binding transcriptional regulator, PadR family [Anaerosporobacter mobilis DSM 15930]